MFVPYSPSSIISPLPPPTHRYQHFTSPDRTCSTVLLSDFVQEEKKKTKMIFCLVKIATQRVSCGTLMYMCIIAQFDSSLFFFFLFQSLFMMVSAGLKSADKIKNFNGSKTQLRSSHCLVRSYIRQYE
jgi:hypothetical protein